MQPLPSACRPSRCGAFLLVAAGTLFLPLVARAQSPARDDVSVTLGGLIQAETSQGWITRADGNDERSRVGLGLRRTRLRATARLGPRFGAFIHVDGDGGTFGVLDAYLSYAPSPRVRLRLGRMASAQPRAFILTPVFAMDATERATIALLWNRDALGNKGRDFGLDLRYQARQGELLVFVHNGDGSFDRLRGNYQENILGDPTGGADRSLGDLAYSAYVALRPETLAGLELGGYAGYNGSGNPNTVQDGEARDYVSYATHVYWGAEPGSQPVRLKADLIGVSYEAIGAAQRQQTLGLSVLGAVAVHRAAEVYGRFESYTPDVQGDAMRDVFVSAGLSVSPARLRGQPYARERLTLGYQARVPEADDAPVRHLLVLQVQVLF